MKIIKDKSEAVNGLYEVVKEFLYEDTDTKYNSLLKVGTLLTGEIDPCLRHRLVRMVVEPSKVAVAKQTAKKVKPIVVETKVTEPLTVNETETPIKANETTTVIEKDEDSEIKVEEDLNTTKIETLTDIAKEELENL